MRTKLFIFVFEPGLPLKKMNKEFSENNFPIIDIVRFEVNVL
jgi:hypothetical protein